MRRTLKAEEGSDTSLLGGGAEYQGKKLFDIEVITSPDVPDGKLLVIDSSAIASVMSELDVDASEHILFDYGSTMRPIHKGYPPTRQRPHQTAKN